MAPVEKNTTPKVLPRVLVVDDEPMLIELVGDIIGSGVEVIPAKNLGEARRIMAKQAIELLVADVNLPDGNGMSLLAALRQQQPTASAIVITGAPSVDGAISAMRQGALDFVPKPFSAEQLNERVQNALEHGALVKKEQRRLSRLRDTVRRLNEARRIVSRKVDLLCNDLVNAYGELSRQLDTVRTQESFRKYLEQAQDLEQLLCHTMDWMLRQMGYSNVAIWLAADEAQFQLGAYMKYTIAGDAGLAEAMRAGLVPLTVKEGILHLDGEQTEAALSAEEMQFLKNQTVLGVNCTYLGEPLAAVIMFRDADKPFTDEDAAVLKLISPIFACSLASAVRGQEQGEDDTDDEDGGGSVLGEEEKDEKGKKNDADWWKRGEQPPF
jgi:FixJ family two-component response regulator